MNDYINSRIDQADALLRAGELTSAHFALKKVLRKEPNNIAALILSAEWHLRSRKKIVAEDIITALFELAPATFDGVLQRRLGNISFECELHDQAAQLFEWAREKKQIDAPSLYRLGICLRRLGDVHGAAERLHECSKMQPSAAAPNMQLGHVYKAIGDTDRAAEHYKKHIALSSTQKGMGYWCLADLKKYTFSAVEVTDMKSELETRRDDLEQSSAVYYALGWEAESRKNFSSAMAYYRQGNGLQAKLKPFDVEQYRHIVAGLCTVPEHEVLIRTNDVPTAILIVGLPRSGTTLIEQILSAHSRVQATDELPFLENIALKLEIDGGYAERLSRMTEAEAQNLQQQYLAGARTYFKQDSDYFVDKYPGNFLHIGLVKRILPQSIIIDARRDPRDVAISAYRQLFNVRNEFATSFYGIYEYYKGYLEMMEHWQSAYPGQLLTLDYERLVSSPDAAIRELLDFCGLDFEPDCLNFHRQKRAVMTPSVSQVMQPVYTTSVGHWRHFEASARDEMSQLGSLLEPDQYVGGR